MPAIIGFCLSIEKALESITCIYEIAEDDSFAKLSPLYMSYIFVLRMFSD